MRRGCGSSFASFRFLEAFPATHRRSARVDSRGRRVGLFAEPLLRRGVRQSRSHRRLRRRRRRSGDRPLATAWHSNKFLDPVTDGAVLPILHLNGYKIANPTSSPASPARSWGSSSAATGGRPYFVEGHEPALMHEAMAATLDTAVGDQEDPAERPRPGRCRAPALADDRSHFAERLDGAEGGGWPAGGGQLPFPPGAAPAGHSSRTPRTAGRRLRSYRPEELFDGEGRLRPELAELAPTGQRRMGANPHANGGMLLRDLRMPDFRDYAAEVTSAGVRGIGDTHVLGRFLRDVAKLNAARNFRVFGPDETLSNGLEALFEVTSRQWDAATGAERRISRPPGRVMEMLSEHQCEGWLEGYLLTGRHGLFNCYEAFIHIVDSMFNQHAKWLKVTAHLPWRKPIASLNYLLASHVWRQDHNGFSHQDPGFIDHREQEAEVVRVYLPPDANSLLWVLTIACAAGITSTSWSRANSRHRSGWRWTPPSGTAPAASASGSGPATTGGRAGCGHGLLRRRAHAGDAGRRLHSARACPT